jgi:outer membrane protein insertion porin family
MALWNTGRFDDIRLEREPGDSGWIVRFVLTERRVVRSIKYDGNKSITISEILDRFKERKVGPYPWKRSTIPTACSARSRPQGVPGRTRPPVRHVEPQIRQIPPSSLEVVFRIEEGPKVKVGEIDIEGNKVFSDRVVRRAMRNLRPIGIPAPSLFENLFAKTFDPQARRGQGCIRQFYQERGYFTGARRARPLAISAT